MRRCLKILGWTGLGLSALLFAATAMFWVRSLGHREVWIFSQFRPNPEWKTGEWAGWGTRNRLELETVHGLLCVSFRIQKRWPEGMARDEHYRRAANADETEDRFESAFYPGFGVYKDGVARVWRFAGAGFSYHRDGIRSEFGWPSNVVYTVALPFWMLAVLFGLWPGLFVTRRLARRKRLAEGLCPQCGYDLRATPERCPECGREVVAPRN